MYWEGWGVGSWGGEDKIETFQNEEKIYDISSVTSAALLMRILDPCSDVADIMAFCQSILCYMKLFAVYGSLMSVIRVCCMLCAAYIKGNIVERHRKMCSTQDSK